MSRGINKVIIVGNLGSDPEGRYMDNNTAVANFSVAVSESWKDKQTGEKKERTEWVRVEMWGKLAEIAMQYLTKGSQVYIEGKMRTDEWTDKEGIKRWSTKVRAETMQMLGGSSGERTTRPPAPQERAQPAEFDDEIPF